MGYEDTLKSLGLELPEAPKPVATYVPAVRAGNLLFLSGVLPMQNGQLAYAGKLGRELTVPEGAEAAKVAGKAFRIPEADMKVYMSRMNYRVEMPKDVVLGHFRGAAEVALGEGIIKKMPDWNDFVRPQLMKEVAPDRAVGW